MPFSVFVSVRAPNIHNWICIWVSVQSVSGKSNLQTFTKHSQARILILSFVCPASYCLCSSCSHSHHINVNKSVSAGSGIICMPSYLFLYLDLFRNEYQFKLFFFSHSVIAIIHNITHNTAAHAQTVTQTFCYVFLFFFSRPSSKRFTQLWSHRWPVRSENHSEKILL